MEKTYRTKQETIKYFKQLAFKYTVEAKRNNDEKAWAKAEAYELSAFELEHNME